LCAIQFEQPWWKLVIEKRMLSLHINDKTYVPLTLVIVINKYSRSGYFQKSPKITISKALRDFFMWTFKYQIKNNTYPCNTFILVEILLLLSSQKMKPFFTVVSMMLKLKTLIFCLLYNIAYFLQLFQVMKETG
jgi:hypothetical protein